MKSAATLWLLACLVGSAQSADPAGQGEAGTPNAMTRWQREQAAKRRQRITETERKRLTTDARYLFDKKLDGAVALIDGELKPFARPYRGYPGVVRCKVAQVLDKTHLLLSGQHSPSQVARDGRIEPSATPSARDETLEPVVIELASTAGYIDGRGFPLRGWIDAGTYQYDAAGGAKKTVALYRQHPAVTYEKFVAYLKANWDDAKQIVSRLADLPDARD